MSEVVAEPAAVLPVPAKAKKPARIPKGQGKPKTPAAHPPVNEMVFAAIASLKERHGSSLQAIKKYIAANYQCDVAKLARFLRKALKNGVEKGKLVQTKGTGASGSFKLTAETKKAATSPEKKPRKAKQTTGGETKKKKKPTSEQQKAKKPADDGKKAKGTTGARPTKKAAGVKKAAAAAAPKQKATKPSKTAAKQPKAPKPKTASPVKKSAPKQAAAKK